jgi:alpha-tubulin suppressor-like RCC1 family protein
MLSISTTPRRSRGAALGLLLLLAAALAGCVGKSVKLGIIDQPENANGFVGGTATFYIGAQGPEPLTFQWKRNGTDIAGATNFSYTTPKLTLADHNAKFSVTISSGSNSLASSEATLTVYDVPTITTQPASQRVALGATATFSVAASGGGTLSYQWLRNDVAVSGATSTSFTTAATVAADDGAVYSVVVINGAGGTASVQVPLVVTSAPSILLQPASQFATEGRAATFMVTGSGGDLAYEWRRGGVAIPGASSASFTTPALVAADSGAVYTVAITNPRGTVTSQSATLTVVAPAAGAPPALPAEIAVGKTTTVGEGFVIVRKSDGTAWAWGHNTAGYLGTGATGADTDTPVQVKIPSSRTVTRIAVGGLHALALLDNGDVYGWGSNASGQLSAGSDVTARSTPTKIALPRPAVAVAAGGDFSVAALDDGSVYAWGNNVLGQLGNGGRSPSISPVKVGDFVSAVAVAAGNSHALALLADGRVYAWGAAALGQIGDGGVVVRRAPVQVASGIARIRAGADSSIAITTGRLVLAWGANASGQLGLGSAFSGNLVTPTGIAVDSVDAAAADSHLLVVASDGSVRGAGLNGSGEIGDGSKTVRKTLTPATGLAGVLTAAAGGKGYSLSLGAGGTVHSWGNNAAKQLGNSSLSTDGTATPTQVPSFDAIP